MLLGNRGGRFHDPATKSIGARRWSSRQWICCVLAFKQRKLDVWGPRYTQLFFLDEITALSAGHRPCMECRRADALAYRAAAGRVLGWRELPPFPTIDRLLDEERRDGRKQRTDRRPAEGLPDGTMFARGGRSFVLRGDAALPWRAVGYGMPGPRPLGDIEVLTPATSVAALAGGFKPLWHPSAGA